MDTTVSATVRKAYKLIQSGKQVEAQALLMPVVRANPNVSEAWYMLGLALTDKEKSIYAFEQVLRLEPSSQRARQQIEKWRVQSNPEIAHWPYSAIHGTDQPASTVVETTPIASSASLPPFPVMTEPTLPSSSAPAAGDEVPTKKRNRLLIYGMAGVLIACLIGFSVLLIANGSLAARSLPQKPSASYKVVTQIPTIATAIPTASPTSAVPVFKPGACLFTVPFGTRVRCGVVRVPQNRTTDQTSLIELPVVVYQSPKANADALIFLQGGPGMEGLSWSLSYFQDYVKPILKEHDMIFFDSRGTGHASPLLDCPKLNPIFLDAYYQNRPQDEAFQDFQDVWNDCRTRFIAAGIEPSAFNTRENAADVHDIVLALGYKQVNLLGIDYGTRAALTVMRDYPEIVRAAVLDSVVPLEDKMLNRRATDTKAAIDKLFASCVNNPHCKQNYPDISYIFTQLVQKFDKTPVSIHLQDDADDADPTIKVNGVILINAIIAGMHQSDLVPIIPKAIYDMYAGDYTFLRHALSTRAESYNNTNLSIYFSTICLEQVYTSSPEQLEADLDMAPLYKNFALTGLFGSTKNLFALCKAWDVNPNDPSADVPLGAKNPTLIISGEYDPATPAHIAALAAADLPNHYSYVIPGMGQAATMGSTCGLSIMMAFLNAPETPPDSSCITSKPFDFFSPYDGKVPVDTVELVDSASGIQGVAPAGWKQNGEDTTYARQAYLFDATKVQVAAYRALKKTVLEDLTKNFGNTGFTGIPKLMDSHKVNGLTWTIYFAKFDGKPVSFALAQTNTSRTLAVIMTASTPDEQKTFYNGLFIPMIDALVPTW